MRRFTPLLVNLAFAGVFRALLPTTLAVGGERYLYYTMSLFFPYTGCPAFHCFRFLPPLIASLLPFEVIDSFIVVGFVCQVLAGTLLWHIAGRFHASRRVALLTVCWFWATWGPLPSLYDPLLIADPVQALWLLSALLLLLDERYLLALPVLVAGAGVKESALTVPVVYAAYLILSGVDVRRRIPWLAALIGLPLATWVIVRRGLVSVFAYASPGDSRYLADPIHLGLWSTWMKALGVWPHNVLIAGLYVFAGFGAAWIFGALGLWRGDRRLRALTAASAPAIAFLALFQEPHRAVACFPWAVLIPASAYIASLPAPLIAVVLAVNAAFTIRMSATVSWLPGASVLFAILIALVAVCLFAKRASDGSGSGAPSPAPTVSGWYTATVPAALAVLMIVVAGYRVTIARSTGSSALALPPPGMIGPDDTGAAGLALAPDESRIAFTGRSGAVSARRLWLARTDSAPAEPMPGTEGATAPFWSPDGRAVGFFADDRVKRVDLESHDVRVIADAPDPRGGAWAPDGTILFAAGFGALLKVASIGGAPSPATTMEAGQTGTSHRWPHLLPDGDHFLFTEIGPEPGEGAVRLGSLRSTESRRILKDAYDAVYARPGLVFFAREGAVRVQPFDVRRLSLYPTDLPTSLPIAVSTGFRRADMAITPRVLAFAVTNRPGDAPATAEPRWVDRAGRPIERSADLASIRRVESSDGTQIALTVRPTDAGLWEIRAIAANGRGPARTIATALPASTTPTSWSPDGRTLLYQRTIGDPVGIWSVATTGTSPPTQLFSGARQAAQAQFSPDGRWIAYSAVERTDRQVWVEPNPPTGERWLVSADGGEQPRWRSDGRELFYIADHRLVMAAVIHSDNGFRVDTVHRLFESNVPRNWEELFQYAVTPDGQQFQVNIVVDPAPGARVTLITNWLRALRLSD